MRTRPGHRRPRDRAVTRNQLGHIPAPSCDREGRVLTKFPSRVLRAGAEAAALVLMASCGDDEAAHAQQLWMSNGPDDYRFIWRTSAMVRQGRFAVEVHDGAVVSIKTLQEGPRVLRERALTVEDVFAELEQLQATADAVEVSYDAELGYPRSVVVDLIDGAVDDEYEFHIEDLHPV